jgi:hypothetical protein
VNTDTTVFFAFLWEAIANENETNGQGVMQAIIDHLTADLPLDFAPDQQATITVTARVDAATSGTIINTAGVTSTELAPSDASEPTTVQAAEPSPPTSGAWPAPRTARATSAPTKPGLPWP